MAGSQRRSGSGTGNAPPALARWISGVSILALSVGLGLAEPEFATDKMSDAELREFRNRSGIVAAPDAAWLLLRGLKTLELRVRRQSETAAELARRV